MRILSPTHVDDDALVSEAVRADYVYMYPPRQAYRPLSDAAMSGAATSSLSRDTPLNLYVHVPFCRQICAYCNLYAVAGVREREHDRYIDAVGRELAHYAPQIAERETATIYIGGGTPSLLAPSLLGRLLQEIHGLGLGDCSQIEEVALEVAPDTATPATLEGFAAAGINRINLGVQSWDDHELALIGRHHGTDVPTSAITAALKTGFTNVCVDLIYGLEGQTHETWRRSVEAVAALRPETICCYPLTLRAWTGFAKRGYTDVSAEALYTRYDIAHTSLTDAGYVQETHVRWILPGRGGYKQKENHWAGQDILGVGAGARSYLHAADLRNGYSVRHRTSTLNAYYQAIERYGHARSDGFMMNDDERRRKDIILGLGNVDRKKYGRKHGVDPVELFEDELGRLEALELVVINDESVSLTALGQRHRDVVVQLFFSDGVRELVEQHSYDE